MNQNHGLLLAQRDREQIGASCVEDLKPSGFRSEPSSLGITVIARRSAVMKSPYISHEENTLNPLLSGLLGYLLHNRK